MKVTDIKSCWITMNRACNLRCEWCYASTSGFNVSDTMSRTTAESLVDICFDHEIRSFVLIGGEPTIHLDLCPVVSRIADRGGKVSIMTNAVALADRSFCERIQDAGGKSVHINVSLKGMSNDDYRDRCGIASFDEVVRGIDNCLELEMTTSFIYIISSANVTGLTDFIRQYIAQGWKKYSLSFGYCTDVVDCDAPRPHDALESVDVDACFNRQYAEIHELMDGNFALHQTLPLCLCDAEQVRTMEERGQIFSSCHLLKRTGAIFDTNGGLLFCNHLIGTALGAFGEDYTDAESFRRFFESEHVNSMRHHLTTMPSMACGKCGKAALCGGGCSLRWFSTSLETLRSQKETKS